MAPTDAAGDRNGARRHLKDGTLVLHDVTSSYLKVVVAHRASTRAGRARLDHRAPGVPW
jgi:hypothetical protein